MEIRLKTNNDLIMSAVFPYNKIQGVDRKMKKK